MEGANTTSPVIALPARTQSIRRLYNPDTTKPAVVQRANDGNGGGRPTKIDEKTTTKLIASFQRGHGVEKTCRYAKISTPTFYRHYNADEEFRSKIDDAKDFWVMTAGENLTQVLQSTDPKHFKTKAEISKWVLEKKEPEEFGRQEKPEGDTNNTQNNYLFISNDQLRKYIESSNIKSLDPLAIVEGLTNPNLGRGNAEKDAVAVHQEALRSGDSTLQSVSAP